MSVKVRLSQWFFAIAGIIFLIAVCVAILLNMNSSFDQELYTQCLEHDGSWINVVGYGKACLTPSMLDFLNKSMNMTLWEPNKTISGVGQ